MSGTGSTAKRMSIAVVYLVSATDRQRQRSRRKGLVSSMITYPVRRQGTTGTLVYPMVICIPMLAKSLEEEGFSRCEGGGGNDWERKTSGPSRMSRVGRAQVEIRLDR